MNIFMGGFLHDDLYRQILTVLAVSSIVVTAVYILRVVGMMLMGPPKEEHKGLPKVYWYERTAIYILILFITLIGVLPFWWLKIIEPGVENFIKPFL
jgi:NADH-quinone oxidoreductase subunit M